MYIWKYHPKRRHLKKQADSSVLSLMIRMIMSNVSIRELVFQNGKELLVKFSVKQSVALTQYHSITVSLDESSALNNDSGETHRKGNMTEPVFQSVNTHKND